MKQTECDIISRVEEAQVQQVTQTAERECEARFEEVRFGAYTKQK
jgi:hypothetical protein